MYRRIWNSCQNRFVWQSQTLLDACLWTCIFLIEQNPLSLSPYWQQFADHQKSLTKAWKLLNSLKTLNSRMTTFSFVLLLSNPAYWSVKICVRLKAQDRTGNMKDLNFLSYLYPWNWKLCDTVVLQCLFLFATNQSFYIHQVFTTSWHYNTRSLPISGLQRLFSRAQTSANDCSQGVSRIKARRTTLSFVRYNPLKMGSGLERPLKQDCQFFNIHYDEQL